jgi:hypothetical protein
VTKSRRMRLAGHVARMGWGQVHTGFWWRNLRERDHLKIQSVGGRRILRWIFKEWTGGMDWIDLNQGGKKWPSIINAVMNLRVP